MERDKKGLYTRRVVITGLGAVAAEAAFGPAAKLIEHLSDHDRLPEGHFAQRYSKTRKCFEKLNSAGSKEEFEEAKQVMIAWFKFNGAEVYADTKGLPLTQKVLEHFLYGEGEPLDVTDPMQRAIVKAVGYPDHLSDEALNTYFKNEIVYGEGHSSGRPEIYADGNVVNLAFSAGSSVNYDEDLYLSLNRYSVSSRGIRLGDGAVQINKVDMFDRYDWDRPAITPRSTKEIVGAFIDKIDYVDRGLMSEIFGHYWDQQIVIDDSEGRLLVDAGIAQEFDIYGGFDVDIKLGQSELGIAST